MFSIGDLVNFKGENRTGIILKEYIMESGKRERVREREREGTRNGTHGWS